MSKCNTNFCYVEIMPYDRFFKKSCNLEHAIRVLYFNMAVLPMLPYNFVYNIGS